MKLLSLARKALYAPSKIPHAAKIELESLRVILRHGLPDRILQFGGGVGDELLLTAVARELKRRNPDLDIWQVSRSPDLSLNNPDYKRIFSMAHWPLRYALFLEGRRSRLSYTEEKTPMKAETPPGEHIIAALCRKAGVRGEISIRPYFFLTDSERSGGRLAERQISILCVGNDSYPTVMRNKLWALEKFQEVADQIKSSSNNEIEVIQLGGAGDPLIKGVKDLRGTTSIRESAAILSQSECFVGTSGFLGHLARAVECRSVIIYGGREHSWQTGYICNENIDSFVDCAPCWLWHDCNHGRKCMTMIEAMDVIRATELVLSRKNTSLETQVVSV